MKNILETAADVGTFKIFIKAILAAGLLDALSEDGPFTIFAPTDEAFNKLPDGAIEDLLKDKEELTELLTYHVVSDRILTGSVKDHQSTATANGQHILFCFSDGVKINDARIIESDINCSNGVIHVIDTVLLPR